MALLVYIDDIVLIGNDIDTCCQFKEYLNNCFHTKDLRRLEYFLGIKIV